MLNSFDRQDREERALCTLAAISNQNTQMMVDQWEEKQKEKKRHCISNIKPKMYFNHQNAKSQKLPFILSKNNVGNDCHNFIKFNHRVSSYIIIEKGLGSYGTFGIKSKKGNLRYFDQNMKLSKIRSQLIQNDIYKTKEALNIKKQSYKSQKSLFPKGRQIWYNKENEQFLSIQKIL